MGEYEVCRKEVLELATQSNETLEASQAEVIQSLQVQDTKIATEHQRQANWRSENERRRHNYVPVISKAPHETPLPRISEILELLKQLSQKRMLKTLFEEAKERKAKKQAEKDKKATANSASADVKMQPQ